MVAVATATGLVARSVYSPFGAVAPNTASYIPLRSATTSNQGLYCALSMLIDQSQL